MQSITFFLSCLLSATIATESPQTCIKTINGLKQSLVARSVNLDSLASAFSPVNRQSSITFEVHYFFCSNSTSSGSSTKFSCDELEEWINDINAGRAIDTNFTDDYDLKFQWYASPVNLFIRPELLKALSLYTFNVDSYKTYLILDELCDNPEHQIDNSTECHAVCVNPSPALLVMQELTADVSLLFFSTLYEVVGGM